MFVSLVIFSLLFARKAVCDDDWELEEEEDEENFAMVSSQYGIWEKFGFSDEI